MSLLRKLWTEEEDDSEVKTAYQYVLDLRQMLEETCQLAQQELSKVQTRNQNYYNRHARSRHFCVGDSKLLLLPTEHNKLTLAWRGPYKVVGKVGNVDYRVEVEPGKVKTYHTNMLKQYFHCHEQDLDSNEKDRNNTGLDIQSEEGVLEQATAIVCVMEDNSSEEDTGATVKDADLLPLYNMQQKETVDDIDINPELSEVQLAKLKQLLKEYKQIFSDVPTVTHLVEHKVQLTQSEPVKCKIYPTPYKMQAVVDQEIYNVSYGRD